MTMSKTVIWEYDPIKKADSKESKSILYAKSLLHDNVRCVITTHPNRLLSTDLDEANRVFLRYQGKYGDIRYCGTLKQMKLLAEDILNNQAMFNRFMYLRDSFERKEASWGDIPVDFDSL